ncbi:hypothetical protein T4C_3587, partial [Trichinella pseudospiralis]
LRFVWSQCRTSGWFQKRDARRQFPNKIDHRTAGGCRARRPSHCSNLNGKAPTDHRNRKHESNHFSRLHPRSKSRRRNFSTVLQDQCCWPSSVGRTGICASRLVNFCGFFTFCKRRKYIFFLI